MAMSGRYFATLLASSLSLVALTQDRPPQPPPPRGERPPRQEGQGYSIEQATSDQAQLHTIAFDGLAFLTGDFASDTFLPPGKASDYFGFQYMRDIDAQEGGHNTSFLTRIAQNMLAILNQEQKAQLLALGEVQERDVRTFAEKRLPLIKAFRRNLEGDLPSGTRGLNKQAVTAASSDLYELDGLIAYQRAKVMATVIRSLDERQKAALASLKFGDSRTWPDVGEQLDQRRLSHEVDVAVMTYASEMFAWYKGSLEADTYFCPERHGMYFGGFGMKTAPAMGKQDYSISTTLTGDSGEAFLAVLTPDQQQRITALVDLQRQDLGEIVRIRRAIATELRRFLSQGAADRAKVLALSKRYGELDGRMSYLYATAFAEVGRTLTASQRTQLSSLRQDNPSDPKGPFLYSSPIRMPRIGPTENFFSGDYKELF
jgi:Spy/CpxP family protein refolding chaperone